MVKRKVHELGVFHQGVEERSCSSPNKLQVKEGEQHIHLTENTDIITVWSTFALMMWHWCFKPSNLHFHTGGVFCQLSIHLAASTVVPLAWIMCLTSIFSNISLFFFIKYSLCCLVHVCSWSYAAKGSVFIRTRSWLDVINLDWLCPLCNHLVWLWLPNYITETFPGYVELSYQYKPLDDVLSETLEQTPCGRRWSVKQFSSGNRFSVCTTAFRTFLFIFLISKMPKGTDRWTHLLLI